MTQDRKSRGKPASPSPQTLTFRSSTEFRAWLSKEHNRTACLLVRIYRKNSGIESLTYAEALDEALCFGWIDGLKRPLDEQSWMQRFTPRKPKSKWSKRNTEHAARLIRENKMMPSGFKEVEAAKADGRWESAYDSPATAVLPPEFTNELLRNPEAQRFFLTLNKANLYAIAYRLQTAKLSRTKARRMKLIIEMLARGEKFH